MDGREFALRHPCCDQTTGVIRVAGGQNVVRCAVCGLAKFNAPKAETGETQRSTQSNPLRRPVDKARILERDGMMCVACGANPQMGVLLQVGHILSIKDAAQFVALKLLTEDDVNSDENLAAMCEECNGGLSAMSLNLRLFAAILIRRRRGGSK